MDEKKVVEESERVATSGTRAVVKQGDFYYVVCATCGKGATFHSTKDVALRKMTANSMRPCKCGAR